TVLEVHRQRHERQVLGLHAGPPPLDLVSVEEELALAGLVVAGVRLGVGVHGDRQVVEPPLASVVDAGEGVADLHLAVPDRLHLGAAQDDAGLERVEDLVVAAGLAVGGDHPVAGRSLGRALLAGSSHGVGQATGAGTGRPTGMVPAVLHLTRRTWAEMIGHAYDGLPDEACGLLAGPPGTGRCEVFYPCRNAAASSKVYTIDPRDHLRADRDADE